MAISNDQFVYDVQDPGGAWVRVCEGCAREEARFLELSRAGWMSVDAFLAQRRKELAPGESFQCASCGTQVVNEG
ncbi:MAG: hypothetical protein V1755_15515, partial [Chloroflexota bacterium]